MLENVKNRIDDEITANGQQKITGAKLNGVLQDMVDSEIPYLQKADSAVQAVVVGATETGEPGSLAKVVNEGTPQYPRLKFVIPRGYDAESPFMGWFPSVADLPTSPRVGYSAYVTATDPAKIYICETDGEWTDSGLTVDSSASGSFETGEVLNQTKIINNLFAGGAHDVLSAEQGKRIFDNFSEQYTLTGDVLEQHGYIAKTDEQISVGDNVETIGSTQLGWRLIRFAIEGDDQFQVHGFMPQGYYGANQYVYYWADVDKGFISREYTRTTDSDPTSWDIVLVSPTNARYLYIMSRTDYVDRQTVKAMRLPEYVKKSDIANDYNGGASRVLSAEKGKELADNMRYYAEMTPLANDLPGSPSAINSLPVGTNVEQNAGSSKYWKLWKYEVDEGQTYLVKGMLPVGWYTFYIYYWADIDGNYIGKDSFHTSATVNSWDTSITAPNGAKYLYVAVQNTTARSYSCRGLTFMSLEQLRREIMESNAVEHIRILAIGNSYALDSLAYVPFLLGQIEPSLRITIGILMQSDSLIGDHYNNFIWARDEDAEHNYGRNYRFWLYDSETDPDAWADFGDRAQDKKSIQWALDNYSWDDIMMLVSRNDGEIPVKFNPFTNLVTDYIDYPVKWGGIVTISRPAHGNGGTPSSPSPEGKNFTEEEMRQRYESSCATVRAYMEGTLVEFFANVFTAARNAYTVDEIRMVGDYIDQPYNDSGFGYLCYFDGVHLQEGLPRQLAAYCVICEILKVSGKGYRGILGDNTKCDAEYLAGRGIPGPKGTPTGYGSDWVSRVRFIQKCAVMASLHPLQETDMNPFFENQ